MRSERRFEFEQLMSMETVPSSLTNSLCCGFNKSNDSPLGKLSHSVDEFVDACIDEHLLDSDSEKINLRRWPSFYCLLLLDRADGPVFLDQSIAKQEKELKPNNSLVGSLVR